MSAEENWDNKLEYLRKSRFLYHNDDYLEFLVNKVWRLDKPCNIADFGCGFGYLGLKFLPLLPEGSGYTGYDKAPSLLEEANGIYSDLPYRHNFINSEVYSVPAEDNSFDVTVSHAVLMHLERAEDALHEMVRVTRSGGMVITCDANRNAFNALFYTTGIDNIQERTPLGLGQQMNRDIREKTGIDYNIGIKTPVLMEKAGLKNIGCRISDCVTFLSPSMDSEKRKHLHETLCNEGLALPEDFEGRRWRDRLKGYGISDEKIQTQLANELQLDFRNRGETYHTLFPGLLTWSYGTV
jgi:SAM-dependent methyltransferase